jgi:hypothetical protein
MLPASTRPMEPFLMTIRTMFLATMSVGALWIAQPASAATDCTPPATSKLTQGELVNHWQKDETGLLYACSEKGQWIEARVARYVCAGDCKLVIELADGTQTSDFPLDRLFRHQDVEQMPEGEQIKSTAQKLGS